MWQPYEDNVMDGNCMIGRGLQYSYIRSNNSADIHPVLCLAFEINFGAFTMSGFFLYSAWIEARRAKSLAMGNVGADMENVKEFTQIEF